MTAIKVRQHGLTDKPLNFPTDAEKLAGRGMLTFCFELSFHIDKNAFLVTLDFINPFLFFLALSVTTEVTNVDFRLFLFHVCD